MSAEVDGVRTGTRGSMNTADVELEPGSREVPNTSLGGRSCRRFWSLPIGSKYCSTSGGRWIEESSESIASLISIEIPDWPPNEARSECGTGPRVLDGIKYGEGTVWGLEYTPRAASTNGAPPSK